jgi:two-component system sensor histidine kinase ChvG
MDAADRTVAEAAPVPDSPSKRPVDSPSRRPEPATTPRRKPRKFSRLSFRIMALSIFPVATIFGGLLYLGAYERSLVEAELNSLSAQARLFASAIAETAVPSGSTDDESLDPQKAAQVMRQLAGATHARARLFLRDGRLSADTLTLRRPYGDIFERDLPVDSAGRWLSDAVFDVYEWFFNLLARDRGTIPIYKEQRDESAADFPEVRLALGGESKATIRRGEYGDIVLFFAVPVQRYKKVEAALLLSASSAEIERSVRQVRLDILRIIAVVTVFTVMLSFYLARSIARPINRLASSAYAMQSSRSRQMSLPDFTERQDEIGDLSAALNDLTSELWRRLDAIESFAADVAHELKNPLASMRSAIETVGKLKDPEKQKRLLDMIHEDVDRLDRLITDISRASRLDSELSRITPERVDIRRLLETLADIHAATLGADRPTLKLVFPRHEALAAQAVEDRLVQVFQNILANAVSFSPPRGVITVAGTVAGGVLRITVDDEGPGIPPGKEKDIFKRFYSERPVGEKFGTHSGLGLSISKQIVEAIGGTLHAENLRKPDGRIAGARFVIKLPQAD